MPRNRIAASVAFVLAIAAASAREGVAGPEYKPLQGQYAIAGKTLIDPPDSEAHDTHAYFELDGSAARDLWRVLKAKAQPDACGDAGDLFKRSGGLRCTQSAGGKEYHCQVGIELGSGRTVDAGAC